MLLRVALLAALIWLALRLFKSATESTKPAHTPSTDATASKPPHEILGVSATASQEEIRAAYQKLVQQYHPDRVAEMGPELRDIAEQRTKEINGAYAALKRSKT